MSGRSPVSGRRFFEDRDAALRLGCQERRGRGVQVALDGPRSASGRFSISLQASLGKRGAQAVPSFGEV
jgi:hypothetical protein